MNADKSYFWYLSIANNSWTLSIILTKMATFHVNLWTAMVMNFLLIYPSKLLYSIQKNKKGRGNSYILTIPFEIIFRIRSMAKKTLILSWKYSHTLFLGKRNYHGYRNNRKRGKKEIYKITNNRDSWIRKLNQMHHTL